MSGCQIDENLAYPASYHFRIIIHSSSQALDGITLVLEEYEVVAPLTRGQSSSAGSYHSYNVSVNLPDRDSHLKLDSAIRAVAGVRIVI